MYKHRSWLAAGNFGFRKYRNYTIRVGKTQALISFAVTAKLTCVFVFAYADCWFSHEAAQILAVFKLTILLNSQWGEEKCQQKCRQNGIWSNPVSLYLSRTTLISGLTVCSGMFKY